MPKDKSSSKEKGSKEGSSGKEVEIVIKRKNSIVDSSGGSSASSSASSSSSENSGNSSDHSQSGDSEYGFDEKGTMTSCEGSSSDGIHKCEVQIRDRTDEMHRLMSANGQSEPLRLVTIENGVPISENTHFVPIQSDDGPSTSASYSVSKDIQLPIKPYAKSGKCGCKPKQLTKKQRKELEKKEKEIAGIPLDTNYPGQRETKKKPIEYVDKQRLHIHHFDDSSGDSVRDGEMVVRGANAAAQSMLGGPGCVAMPYYRQEEDLGPQMTFTDVHKTAQARYCKLINTIGKYTSLPAAIKPLHRMGYGIAASGLPEPDQLILSICGAKPFMKHNYSDYLISSKKIDNWHQDFMTNSPRDVSYSVPLYHDVAKKMADIVRTLPDLMENDFMKRVFITIRDLGIDDVLLRFGEMERWMERHDEAYKIPHNKEWKRMTNIQYFVSEALDWCSKHFVEQFDDYTHKPRSFNMLMYLSARLPKDKPCHEADHRKCTVLHFLLNKCVDREKYLGQKFPGGNTILHLAAMLGEPCQIDVLLRYGAPLNELNDYFKSPIALATKRNVTLPARQLMWFGADVGTTLSLTHIAPRSLRETENKEWGDYYTCLKPVSEGKELKEFTAYAYMCQRVRALNASFVSWVESLLIDAENRMNLGVHSVKSGLHTIRIGRDMMDSIEVVGNRGYVKKTFRMAIERSEFHSGVPVTLFFIPCQYNRDDTTMQAAYPHVVRIPMLTDSEAVAATIKEKEDKRRQDGDSRIEYKDEMKDMRPLKLFEAPVLISFGDVCVDRIDSLKSFFSYEHNGIIYGYDLPDTVSHTENEYTCINVTLTIAEHESIRFKDAFFMCQALQVENRGSQRMLYTDLNGGNKDPRAATIQQQVNRRRAEKAAEEAQRMIEEQLRIDHQIAMRNSIQMNSAHRRTERDRAMVERRERAERAEAELANAALEAAFAAKNAEKAPQAPPGIRKQKKTKTE